MKIKIITTDGYETATVLGKSFKIKEAPGYKFLLWRSCDNKLGFVTEYQTGMCVRNTETKEELIELIKSLGFEKFDKQVKWLIKKHGVLNK